MNSNLRHELSLPQALAHAEALVQEGRLPEAEALCRQVLAVAPHSHRAYYILSLIANGVGKLPAAVELIGKAIEIERAVALYHRDLGEFCRRLGHFDKAIAAGKRAAALSPEDPDVHYSLGVALSDRGEPVAAIACYRRALELAPFHKFAWNGLGVELQKTGDQADAEKAYARAVAIHNAEEQNKQGVIHSEQGRLEEARRCFDEAIAAQPDFVQAHYNLCALKTYTAEDPHLTILEQLVQASFSMPIKARIRYNFVLGKAREDVGDYEGAFQAYAEGNRLQHSLQPYDEEADEASNRELRQMIRVFDRAFFERHKSIRPQNAQRTPVFIVGMPRSGTTLIEQILSSHPSLFGAGERMDLTEVISGALSLGPKRAFLDVVEGLSASDLAALGDAYLERLWKLAPDAVYITDKMPGNYLYLGMIHLMLPQAKIIHTMRDPMASCFSCYATLFSEPMAYTYDLGTLGRHYVRYMELMQHWKEVLPPGMVLDVHYEDMVDDLEGQSRRILEHLGMDWNEACLEFYRNERPVKTASVGQVRQPIYHTSVARWEHFRTNLEPLLQIVGNYR